MAGPWEDYQQKPAETAETGPWSAYGAISPTGPRANTAGVALPESDNSISGRFLKTVTSDSPLNPMNWSGMVKSAFANPFSGENLNEAQRDADVFTGKQKPEGLTRGDIGEGLGQAANAGLTYGALKALPAVGSGITAVADPEVIDAIPGGKTVSGIRNAVSNAYRRARATATPDTVFSVSGDARPLYGPERPPAPVLRDANSPAWAQHTSPVIASSADVEPIRAPLPSGRVGPAPPSRINPPPAPSLPQRVPLWERAGVESGPVASTPNVDPIYPQGVMPSGRLIGPLNPAPSPLYVPRQEATILPEPLTSPSPAVPATTQPTAPGNAPDYSPITRQYKTSPSKAKFGANGKRIF